MVTLLKCGCTSNAGPAPRITVGKPLAPVALHTVNAPSLKDRITQGFPPSYDTKYLVKNIEKLAADEKSRIALEVFERSTLDAEKIQIGIVQLPQSLNYIVTLTYDGKNTSVTLEPKDKAHRTIKTYVGSLEDRT